jgi:Fe-S-cluster containining protein
MTKKPINDLLNVVSRTLGNTLGGSACNSCSSSHCCEFQHSVGISQSEFDHIQHLVTSEQIKRAKEEVNKKSIFRGKPAYRCPFLSDVGKCEIYDERFIVCSTYSTVGDPANCAKNSEVGEVEVVNPLSIVQTALSSTDKPLASNLMKLVTDESPITDILQEFIKRYKL